MIIYVYAAKVLARRTYGQVLIKKDCMSCRIEVIIKKQYSLKKQGNIMQERFKRTALLMGEEALEKLAGGENCVGFIFDGIDKSELFDYIKKYGTLPRKTFSMGEAESKRYYLEARNIKETLI